MLSVPGVHVAIVGARRFGQLQDSIAASEAALTEADIEAIEGIRSFATFG
jgi:aryl-alcohol dehydrogenase-like predicted oxidoreductase